MDWNAYIGYRCVVGSRAFGLSHEASDSDVRGFYLPPTQSFWGFAKPPEQLESEADQTCFWELEKFLRLALQSNPNVLECLNTPIVEHASPLAKELLDMRDAFPSKAAFARYKGYAEDQFRKLENARSSGKPINWKHAMHLVRLLISGEHLLRTGEVRVDVSEHRKRLLAVKRGELDWKSLDRWRTERLKRLEEAAKVTPLPDEPDRVRVEAFLVRARETMLSEG